ncbi:MAG TPA: tryptophan 2,3-dioxygenase family protein [Pseudobdellovibrionaceae bacterium]|nr:tryptophan 2,3-dioxygenase family protein [Pseudobdellovibrionaceae bacterium]
MSSTTYPPISYADYLKTNELLNQQKLRSEEFGRKAHDEMLFIIVHQTYELWFKQMLHELDSVLGIFAANPIPEQSMLMAVHRLSRMVEIHKLLVDQVSVMETMTPLDFLDFRDMLYPASGFQSTQWRLLENKLGLKRDQRLTYNAVPYHAYVNEAEAARMKQAEAEPSLFDRVDEWLTRTPFLKTKDFDFANVYGQAVRELLQQDREAVRRHAKSDEDRERNLKSIDETEKVFNALFDASRYAELKSQGHFRLSHEALQAALLILLYRDQPIFALPFQLLTKLQDLDELMTQWRYRHSLMAHRMLGSKIGTGGSSGAQYLKAATEKHRVFADLFNLATFLIPRSKLPALPESLTRKMNFTSP